MAHKILVNLRMYPYTLWPHLNPCDCYNCGTIPLAPPPFSWTRSNLRNLGCTGLPQALSILTSRISLKDFQHGEVT
jgi:hypothetical protein